MFVKHHACCGSSRVTQSSSKNDQLWCHLKVLYPRNIPDMITIICTNQKLKAKLMDKHTSIHMDLKHYTPNYLIWWGSVKTCKIQICLWQYSAYFLCDFKVGLLLFLLYICICASMSNWLVFMSWIVYKVRMESHSVSSLPCCLHSSPFTFMLIVCQVQNCNRLWLSHSRLFYLFSFTISLVHHNQINPNMSKCGTFSEKKCLCSDRRYGLRLVVHERRQWNETISHSHFWYQTLAKIVHEDLIAFHKLKGKIICN